MASKVAGVLIVCVVLAAMFGTGGSIGDLMDAYKNCFVDCHKTCQGEGNGNTFCEMKCDSDCMAQETAAKLNMVP
ncbi:major pollen allergen Ole e 6-like [Syzygium oleosum]|uniref:major pollen allergen Ole e 6-like n=1 Tax=Syzygium oleosum TaxID=219896 RepID=UPI0024BA3A73|nr:major pollen allergen Ole e 6-like [Syzygium oleosum]